MIKRLYIFWDDQSQRSNGSFSLLKVDSLSIWITGDDVSREVNVFVYQRDEEALKKVFSL